MNTIIRLSEDPPRADDDVYQTRTVKGSGKAITNVILSVSEGSDSLGTEILRCAQDDIADLGR